MNKLIIKSLIEETKGRKIVCITKYVQEDEMIELLSYGLNDFGENRVNDFIRKYNNLKDYNIVWHFVGHLQKNKCDKIIDKIDYLHSLDSLELAYLINKRRVKPLDCFIELKLVSNNSKYGVTLDKLDSFLKEIKTLDKINIIGFMVMSDKGMSDDEISDIFKKANDLKSKYGLSELSMGMSDDYKIALKNGTTYLRLGRILFS